MTRRRAVFARFLSHELPLPHQNTRFPMPRKQRSDFLDFPISVKADFFGGFGARTEVDGTLFVASACTCLAWPYVRIYLDSPAQHSYNPHVLRRGPA